MYAQRQRADRAAAAAADDDADDDDDDDDDDDGCDVTEKGKMHTKCTNKNIKLPITALIKPKQ